MNRLLLSAALCLTACSSAVPRVAVEPRGPEVTAPESAYLVWTRADAGDASTYETMLVSRAGEVLARRPGVFVASGASLYEVRVEREVVPSLACKMDLWDKPRAELPEDALEDQIFERVELVDVASGEHKLPIVTGDGNELSTNEYGLAMEVGSRRMKIEGSIGPYVSVMQTGELWGCGTMRANEEIAHGYDIESGKPVTFGGCSEDTEGEANERFAAMIDDGEMSLSETSCVGVSLALDTNRRFVGVQHRETYAQGPFGSPWRLADAITAPLPDDFEVDPPASVRRVFDATPSARGWSEIGETASALFRRAGQ